MIKPAILSVLVLLFLGLAAKAYYDTNSIEIKHYQINHSSLAKVLAGLKVAHLSDLHIKSIGLKENKILEILKGEKPDLVFITGDSISFEGPYEPAISFFHQFEAPLGVYAVMGNTEYSNENGSCILCHKEKSRDLKEKQSPVLLRNSMVFLKINEKVLNLIGVDDPVGNKSNLRKALKEGKQEIPSILLAHSPEVFDEASGSGIDLILSGHTHGGQIFLTKYLRKIFPLEASLEFIGGFFQNGKTLMYVNRGIGNSFLPFHLGVKPEITFLSFLNNSTRSTNPSNPSNPINSFTISNKPSKTIFTGLSLSSFIETFNILNIFESTFLTAAQQHGNTAEQKILFDFESASDLESLNWECHKWFERSEAHVTSGKHSLKVVLPPGQYPGINFRGVREDWSKRNFFKMDVFNPSEERFNFHVRIDDHKSGWEYAHRFDTDFELKPGMNSISIPMDSIKTNINHRPLNVKKIKRLMVFVPKNNKSREIYIDHIRLE
jgi:predicted MPP superfamily phosphohydrolase